MAIEAYQFGRMVIDGKSFTSDVIIFPDKVQDSWWRREGHKLWPVDLPQILAGNPTRLVVGTGAHGLLVVTAAALTVLAERDIEVVAEPTAIAWKTYNRLAGPTVIGAFHLTC